MLRSRPVVCVDVRVQTLKTLSFDAQHLIVTCSLCRFPNHTGTTRVYLVALLLLARSQGLRVITSRPASVIILCICSLRARASLEPRPWPGSTPSPLPSFAFFAPHASITHAHGACASSHVPFALLATANRGWRVRRATSPPPPSPFHLPPSISYILSLSCPAASA